jgi:hypothetical protein
LIDMDLSRQTLLRFPARANHNQNERGIDFFFSAWGTCGHIVRSPPQVLLNQYLVPTWLQQFYIPTAGILIQYCNCDLSISVAKFISLWFIALKSWHMLYTSHPLYATCFSQQ